MSRNNSRRNKVEKPPPTAQNLPGLPPSPPQSGVTFVVPTEFIDLPSCGKPYIEQSSMYKVDKVEIKYMTAREEDVLVNQDYINRGIVLDKLIESVLIDRRIKVEDIADADKIAILAHARKTGYGNEYKYSIFCDKCESDQVYTFDLEKLISNAMEESADLPEDVIYNEQAGTFIVELPVSKHRITCKVLNNDDQKYILDLEDQRKKHSIDFNYTIEFLRRTILEVLLDNELKNNLPITKPEIISQFLDFLPALDSKKIKIVHNSLTPSFRMHQEVACPSCSSMTEREVPFSWAWFWNN